MSTCSTSSAPLTEKAIAVASEKLAEIQAIYHQPFLQLLYQAGEIHQAHQRVGEVQLATLANIKSGKCPEDCKIRMRLIEYNATSTSRL